jgi:phosphoadenosine phosphosulfate reductase
MAFMDNHEFTSPQDVLRWTVDTYGSKLAITTSFQPSGIVILHMLQPIAPHIDVLTIDTGLLFPETYRLMDEVEAKFHLNLLRIRPKTEPIWQDDPDLCCHLRKVLPLGEALQGYDAWVVGLRRDQSSNRSQTPVVQRDKKYGKIKIAPLATWMEAMVWTYIHAHNLPYNPLHDQSYPSIGCFPCTQPVAPDADDRRTGRWSNLAKNECGIHQ